MSMNKWRRYKDVLCHPGSELEKLLASGEDKKAARLHAQITQDGYLRGEFVDNRFRPHDVSCDCTLCRNDKEWLQPKEQ